MLTPIPNPYPPEADEFIVLYRRVEHALNQHPTYLQGRKKATVDWGKFSISLGIGFFVHVATSGKAIALLTEPPRAFHQQGGWLPKVQTPVLDVNELFIRGVCQVRHNIEHAGKFLEPEQKRSYDLVGEAFWVLSEAVVKHPSATQLFS